MMKACNTHMHKLAYVYIYIIYIYIHVCMLGTHVCIFEYIYIHIIYKHPQPCVYIQTCKNHECHICTSLGGPARQVGGMGEQWPCTVKQSALPGKAATLVQKTNTIYIYIYFCMCIYVMHMNAWPDSAHMSDRSKLESGMPSTHFPPAGWCYFFPSLVRELLGDLLPKIGACQ